MPSTKALPVFKSRLSWDSLILIVLILGGMGLSLIVNQASSSVRNVTHPLLREGIPTLRNLADFESALLRYQLSLNKYYASSITRERYLEISEEARSQMDGKIDLLLRSISQQEDKAKADENYKLILSLGPELDMTLTSQTISWDEARRILADLNAATVSIRSELKVIRTQSEDAVLDASDRVASNVDTVSWLVHIFNGASLLAALFLIYLFRARLSTERKLALQALIDPLTGLPNRRHFESRVQKLDQPEFRVLLGVIDRFERVTAGFGHTFADKLIQELMQRVSNVVEGRNAEVFRLDGANFAVLCCVPCQSEALFTFIVDLQAKVSEPFDLDGREIHVSLSLGIAEYPAHGKDATELLKNSDAALQAAREEGNGSYMLYSPLLNAKAQERLELEAALRHAIEKVELELYYQPQMRLVDGTLVGFEALIRWRRDGKLVSPAEFIPIAEASGSIVPIGDWILEQACRQAKMWTDIFGRKISVAINISPRQFRHPEFALKVEKALRDSRVDPACIELEITEGIVMEGKSVVSLLRRIRHLGVSLAVDDFGTGYSSLGYLKHFPVDKLKIDQSFIRNLTTDTNDAAITQAVITLGHHLGLAVIAEGVEDEEQERLLSEWSCDEIQGYKYGKPMTVDQASVFIDQEQRLLFLTD